MSFRRIGFGAAVAIASCLPPLAAGDDAGPIDRPPGPVGSQEVLFEGRPTPGSRIAIGPEGPARPGSTYRWTQVEGPPTTIDDPSAARIRVTIPADARRLAFHLTTRDDQGERVTRVVVPVAAPSTSGEAPPGAGPTAAGSPTLPVADPGDDQVGLVGHRITLNGGNSRPSGRLGHRWMQVSGPPTPAATQDGPYLTFTPREPGIYRFALLVGHQSQVSEPRFVSVEVGQRPIQARAPQPEGPRVARWAAGVLATIPNGAEVGDEVADVFESIAERVPLYSSYGQLQSELARRIDVVIPVDPAARAAWTNQVFAPLTQFTTAELLAAGVDLRGNVAPDRPLDAAQKERIQAYFRTLAGAFRPRPNQS